MRSFNIEFTDTKIIRDFEGLRLKEYKCQAGVRTIGWGTTEGVTEGMVITEQQAKDFFMRDVQKFIKAVDGMLKVEVTKNQYIALLSLCYNIGSSALSKSTLIRILNAGEPKDKVAEQFLKWNKVGGKENAGLTKRRIKEKELFLKA